MFPKTLDPTYFDRVYRLEPEQWREPFEKLWTAYGPGGATLFQPFRDGSNLIAAFGDSIVKVFPPFLQHQWVSERRGLMHMQGKLKTPVPRLQASGPCGDGWTFLIMSRLPGVTLEGLWPRMGRDDRIAVLYEIGALMVAVHGLPADDCAELEPRWQPFLAKQVAGCHARHARLQMPDWFLQPLDAFVQASLPLLPTRFTPVLLTGEYTPFNLLVADQPRVQTLAGMIDFGDAMVGYARYDLIGPMMFSCEGDARLIQALLTGYGIPVAQQNQELRRELFLLMILHRYSDFKAQVRIPDWMERVGSLEELEALIWPL